MVAAVPVLAGALALGALVAGVVGAVGEKPNVVIFFVDDLG